MKKQVILLAFLAFVLDMIIQHQVQVHLAAILPVILGALSVASSAYGSIKSSEANKNNQGILDGMQEENTGDFLKEYHRGALDNPGSKAYLKKLEAVMEDNRNASENNAAATGATHENVLAEKQSNNRVMSDAIAGLVEREDSRQQQYRQGYLGRKQGLLSSQMGMNAQRAQTWAEVGQGLSSAAGSLAGSYLESSGKFIPKIQG